MAAVTLKDLMSPLSKIEAYANETNESIKKIEEFIVQGMGNSSNGGDALSAQILATSQQQLVSLRNIEFILGRQLEVQAQEAEQSKSFAFARLRQNAVDRIFGNKDSKNLELIAKASTSKSSGTDKGAGKIKGSGAQALKDLGMGALLTGKAMLLWTIVPKKAVDKFLDFVVKSFEKFEQFDVKKVQKGIDALDSMGGAIMKFATALALSTPLILVGLIGLPILIPTLFIMGGVFYLLGGKKFSKRIKRGSRALTVMAEGLLAFGIGLAVAALASMIVLMQPAVLIGMTLSILLIGGAVSLLGSKKMSKNIKRGAGTLSIIGLGLVVFGLGYALFAAAFPSTVGIGDILIQSITILGIGTAIALVGKFGVNNILQGALSLAVNGIGLLVFNMGYVPFADATKGMSLGDIGIQSGVLLAVGGIMALAGLAVAGSAGAVLLGPALYAAAGGSLLLLAPGLQAMKDLDFSEQDSKDLATTLGAVAMAFSGINPESGVFGMIGGLFTRVIQSGSGLAASAMYAGAGLALQELSKGLSAFKDVGFTEDDSKELAIALGSVSGAFAQAGGEPASPGGLFGAIFGNTFSPNATERGIDSVMDSGKALMEITKGLGAFLDLKKKYGLDGDAFKDGGYLNTAITETLGFLNSAFAAIGANETSDSAMFGLFQWDENNVEKGIDAVKGSGKALKDITEGLAGFLDLRKKYGLTEEAFKSDGFLAIAIKDSLGFVSKAFATIGGMEVQDGWGPFSWDENLVEKGIDAVKGAGTELTNIAQGLKSFQELIKQEVDFAEDGDLAKAVTNSLTFVGDAFAVIGGKEEKDGWFIFSWDENKIAKGVEAVQGAGTELMNIATGLETFQKLIDQKVDWDILGTAISKSLTFVGDAFAVIGGKEVTDSTFFGLVSWDENLVQKGIENVQGAGEELMNIAEGLSKFASLDDPAATAKSITTLFNSIADAFTANYERAELRSEMDHFGEWVKDLSDAVNDGSLSKAGTDLEKIASVINSVDIYKADAMASLFSGASELGRNTQAYSALADAVEQIRDLLAEQAGGGAEAEGGTAEGGTTGAQSQSGLKSSLARLNSTMGRLESTMGMLPASIQSIKIVIPED